MTPRTWPGLAPTTLTFSQPSFSLKLAPSLHSDLRTVEFTLVFQTGLLGLLTTCLASISPTEIIEFPEGVCWKDEIPDWKRDQVDQHPDDIRPTMSGQDNQDGGKTENKPKQYKRNDLYRSTDDRNDDCVLLEKLFGWRRVTYQHI